MTDWDEQNWHELIQVGHHTNVCAENQKFHPPSDIEQVSNDMDLKIGEKVLLGFSNQKCRTITITIKSAEPSPSPSKVVTANSGPIYHHPSSPSPSPSRAAAPSWLSSQITTSSIFLTIFMPLHGQLGTSQNIIDNMLIRLPKILMLKVIFHPFLQTLSSCHFHRMNTGHEIRTAAQEMGNCNLVRRKQPQQKKSEYQLRGINFVRGNWRIPFFTIQMIYKTPSLCKLPRACSKCQESCKHGPVTRSGFSSLNTTAERFLVSKGPRLMGFPAFQPMLWFNDEPVAASA